MSEQSMEALRIGNEVRLRIAGLRRDVKAGRRTVPSVLGERALRRVPVGALLRWQHGWGRERARAFCLRVGVHREREVGELTDRERLLIQAALSSAPRVEAPAGPVVRVAWVRTSRRALASDFFHFAVSGAARTLCGVRIGERLREPSGRECGRCRSAVARRGR